MASKYMQKIRFSLCQQDALYLYGLWKQATIGNCQQPRPIRINAMALQKWRAWKSHGQISSSVAMMEYIRFATEVTLRLRAKQGKRSEKNGDSDASDGQLPKKHQNHTPQLAPLKDARQTASDGPHDGGSSSGMISPIRLPKQHGKQQDIGHASNPPPQHVLRYNSVYEPRSSPRPRRQRAASARLMHRRSSIDAPRSEDPSSTKVSTWTLEPWNQISTHGGGGGGGGGGGTMYQR